MYVAAPSSCTPEIGGKHIIQHKAAKIGGVNFAHLRPCEAVNAARRANH
jgi:hypothetical protein